MPKKILLIENDSTFAATIAASLEASGFEVRTTGDGKEGLDLARDWSPDGIVLCVELPSLSGYLVCQKLKKDDALKAIPLILTSAEATEETFEKHRTLKARADDYLLKPYQAETLLEKLGVLVGLPEGGARAAGGGDEGEEELVSLEEEVGLDGAPGEPDAEVPGLSLESLPDEPAARAEQGGGLDDDLRLLDDAFEGLSAPPAAGDAAAALDELSGEKPVSGEEVDAAAASLPEEDEGAARADLGAFDADAALGALGGGDEALSPGLDLEAGAPPPVSAPPLRGASADLLRAAGIKLLDEDDSAPAPADIAPLPPDAPAGAMPVAERSGDLPGPVGALERTRAELAGREAELRELRRSVEAFSRRADAAESELAQARARADAAQEKMRKAEGEAKAARDDARRAAEQAHAAEAETAELRRKTSDAERRASEAEKRMAQAEEDARRKREEAAVGAQAIARAEALEREAEELRTEVLVARGEAEGAREEVERRTAELNKRLMEIEGARAEVERRTAELNKRLTEIEGANAKNEERVVKAYQKIKADEKVRDKVRKALAIASQLLEEGVPSESPAEKERRAASGVGRE